jgi:hypothetical protein
MRTIDATVIKAGTPRMRKDGTPRTSYISISVNIEHGYVHVCTCDSLREATDSFKNHGDPALWRGVQIIKVTT